jgi:hypothetical protein
MSLDFFSLIVFLFKCEKNLLTKRQRGQYFSSFFVYGKEANKISKDLIKQNILLIKPWIEDFPIRVLYLKNLVLIIFFSSSSVYS